MDARLCQPALRDALRLHLRMALGLHVAIGRIGKPGLPPGCAIGLFGMSNGLPSVATGLALPQ